MKRKADNTPDPSGEQRVRPLTLVILAAVALAAVVLLMNLSGEPEPSTDAVSERPTLLPIERLAVYLPAEFDPQEALLLGGTQLVSLFPEILADIVEAVAGEVTLRVLAGSPGDAARIDSVATSREAPVTIMELPVRSMWVRDFGPVTVSDIRGRRHLVDFHYRERRGNKIDDDIPRHIGDALDYSLEASPLLVEGGDFLTNGRGYCLMSTRVVNRNAHYLDLEPSETINNLAALLGLESISLAVPLEGESTGHVDMFAAFLAADLVLVGEYETDVDAENAARLNQLALDLATRETLLGPLRVERIPMPDHDDGVWRTYTNIVFANNVVLVPTYPDYCPDLDAVALATYRRLLPERKVVGVDVGGLIRMYGALRCITMNLPRGGALQTTAPVE